MKGEGMGGGGEKEGEGKDGTKERTNESVDKGPVGHQC